MPKSLQQGSTRIRGRCVIARGVRPDEVEVSRDARGDRHRATLRCNQNHVLAVSHAHQAAPNILRTT